MTELTQVMADRCGANYDESMPVMLHALNAPSGRTLSAPEAERFKTSVPLAGRLSRLKHLLARYDAAIPRYTSYPPIPCWTALDGATVQGWLAGPTAGDGSLSLYTHIPFCRSRCHYCGCWVVISPHAEPAERYVATVQREMLRTARLLGPGRRVRQYHLGGGTPNFVAPPVLERLLETARTCFSFEPEAELSLEADPRHLSAPVLRALRSFGFRRLSLGVQDFDAQVQAAVNRVQPYALVAQVLEAARAAGFHSVNLDLIYGLPRQNLRRFGKTVERVLALRPDRLALYNFAYLPGTFPHQRRLEAAALPDPDEKLTMFLAAGERFVAGGYRAIGLDHFALESDELAQAHRDGTLRRNFMGYTTRPGTDLVGFGISAISECGGRYWQNEKKLVRYERAIAEGRLPAVRGLELDGEDRLRQALIGALLCQGRADFGTLGARFGVDLHVHLAREISELASMEADGLVTRTADGLEVTEAGQLFLRNVAYVFDARTRSGTASFSRSV